jgi:hypothetical protein
LKDEYFVFKKQGYDKMYWCVAGKEITHNTAAMFNTHQEAQSYADSLNNQKETIPTRGSN